MSTFLVSKIMLFTVFLQNIKKINGHPMILFLYVGQSIKKQRYHFADKGSYSQRYVFPVVTYVCESWTIKKAECWKN